MGLLMSLPRDLIYEVGINCDPLTLLAAARVSKHNRDLADNPKLWESVFRDRWNPSEISNSRWRYMHLDIGIRFSNMMSCDSPLRLLPHMIFWKYATLSMLEYHYVSWSPKMKYTPTGAISSLKIPDSIASFLKRITQFQIYHYPELASPKFLSWTSRHEQGDFPNYSSGVLCWKCRWECDAYANSNLDFNTWYHVASLYAGITDSGEFAVCLVHDNDYELGITYNYESNRIWSTPEAFKNQAKAFEIFRNALDVWKKYSTSNTHLSPTGELWHMYYSDHVTNKLQSEHLYCAAFRRRFEDYVRRTANRALKHMGIDPVAHTSRFVRQMDGLIVEGPREEAPTTTTRPSKLNYIAAMRCIRRLASFLVQPLALASQKTILQKDDVTTLNGMIDIIEYGGMEVTHWRGRFNLTPKANEFREQLRTSTLRTATVGSSTLSLYHLCLYYVAVPLVARAIASVYMGQTCEQRKLIVESLSGYFPVDSVQECLSIIERSLVQCNEQKK